MAPLKVSIVTVSFNASKTIEATIKSVLSQTYKNIEYIIVDGKSTDDTLKIVGKYKKKISKVISEKDKGLYDAMNKGVKNAKGDVVYFLNADDVLKDKDVVKKVVSSFESDLTLVYGDIECFYPSDKQRVRKSRISSINKLKWGIMPPHQGSFVKREWLLKNPFDINYKSAADFDSFCRMFIQNKKSKKIDLIVSVMIMGGISSSNSSYYETERIVLKYFGYFNYLKLMLRNRLFILTKYIFKKLNFIGFWHKLNNAFNIF